MKIREDSPFAKITEEQIELLQESAEEIKLEDLANEMELSWNPKIVCSVPALRRFLRRIKTEKLLEEARDCGAAMMEFAEEGKGGKLRDGAIEATRQRLLAQAVEAEDKETLLEVFRTLNTEKEKDRALAVEERLAAAEERKAAVAEENAKLGWRKLEWQRAASAARLLPQVRELLMEPNVAPEERITRALGVLMGQGVEGKLLLEAPTK